MTAVATAPKKKRGPFGRLYHGETNIDFVGRTKLWFAISAVILGIGLVSLFTRGLNLGIDFEGGAIFEVASPTLTVTQATDAVAGVGVTQPKVLELKAQNGTRSITVQTKDVPVEKSADVKQALATAAGLTSDDVSVSSVSATWGKEISQKAVRALIAFLIVITLYISFRFEFKMAVPTLIALVHDVLMTIGIYSLSGLEVTPATVVAVLTILGFSIYDGIVVFDKVHENTRLVSAGNRMSYGKMVNLSLNQTLMRSLNTSITALIPILSLLVVGSLLLGAKTLEEFGLALFIGLASGAYSSIFVASPLLAIYKEREPRYVDIRRRIEARGDRDAAAVTTIVPDDDQPMPDVDGGEPQPVGVTNAAPRPASSGVVRSPAAAIPPRPRKKGKRR